MSTLRLFSVVCVALGVLSLGAGARLLFAVLGLAVLLVVGELWLRALIGEVIAPVARLGLGSAAGLVTLPVVAIALHVLDVPIRSRSLAAALLAVATMLASGALLRERRFRPPADPRLTRTVAAVLIPGALALLVAGAAVYAYQRLPHPAPPGYVSVALNGWAATISRPVAIPARGIQVPIRVSSAGKPDHTALLRVRVGDRLIGPPRALAVAADTTRSVAVHVPAPPDGCLHRIEISVDLASTVFYGRGPAAC